MNYTMQSGPTNLDLECKAALQQILRPSNYGVINPWMQSASVGMKRDMVQLAAMVREAGQFGKTPQSAALLRKTTVIANPSGRQRAANVVPVTADRAQQDLLRVRCGSEVTDVAVEEKRRYFARYSRIPSTDSIADFYRLTHAPVHMEESTKVLTEQARARLQKWQIMGPESNPNTSAEIMRSLRSIASAVNRLPTYAEHTSSRQPGSQGLKDSLYEYSKVVPRGGRILKEPRVIRKTPHTSSAPAILRPVVEPADIEAISKPGGYVCKLMDQTPLQMLKNKSRATQSQVQMSGGSCDWKTSYSVMSMDGRVVQDH
eukprot:TRINITY_DN110651_c0_g1_i1.p1 TRINITY_DN110651_c0_g1~~TRINITY_DN110651_c0_g1_i1.p1  ORF type:complete len:316 (-),score=56.09 TRINITY_DN110651_c0_g1_i1:126-1073(-)